MCKVDLSYWSLDHLKEQAGDQTGGMRGEGANRSQNKFLAKKLAHILIQSQSAHKPQNSKLKLHRPTSD